MHPELQNFLTNVNSAFDLVLKHKLLFLLVFLIDVAFFAGVIFAQVNLLSAANEPLQEVLTTVQKQSEGLNETELLQLESKLYENPEFMEKYRTVQVLTGYFFAAIILLWALLQGINLVLSQKLVHKKINYLKVYGLFLFWSIAWFAISFAALIFLSSFAPIIKLSPEMFNLIFFLFNVVLAYFMFVALSLLNKGFSIKLPFLVGKVCAKNLVSGFLLIVLVVFISLNVAYSIIKLHPLFGFVGALLLLSVVFSFFRIYFINLVEQTVKTAENLT